MVRRTYPGIMFPESDLATLGELRREIIKLKENCRPFDAQYCALDKVKAAIDECAGFFTGDPTFFHRKPPVGNGC